MGELGEYWREHRDHKFRAKMNRERDDDSYTMGDVFKAFREGKKERRAATFERNHKKLAELGLQVEFKNFNHHAIITVGKEKADFWPASGKWFLRSKSRYGAGLEQLMKLLNGEGMAK